jgi:spermidine synthase
MIFLLISGIVAYCSMNYELLLAQSLSLVLGQSFLHFTLTIGIYLFFLGMGSLLLSLRRQKESWEEFIFLELLLSGLGLCLPALIFAGEHVLRHYQSLAACYLYCLVALIAVLSGWEIPLLVQLVTAEYGKERGEGIIAADYVGTFVAAVSFPFLIFSRCGLFSGAAVTALCNLLAALLLLHHRGYRQHPRACAGLGLGVFICAGVLIYEPSIRNFASEAFIR